MNGLRRNEDAHRTERWYNKTTQATNGISYVDMRSISFARIILRTLLLGLPTLAIRFKPYRTIAAIRSNFLPAGLLTLLSVSLRL